MGIKRKEVRRKEEQQEDGKGEKERKEEVMKGRKEEKKEMKGEDICERRRR